VSARDSGYPISNFFSFSTVFWDFSKNPFDLHEIVAFLKRLWNLPGKDTQTKEYLKGSGAGKG
jgi:hypothetical protein